MKNNELDVINSVVKVTATATERAKAIESINALAEVEKAVLNLYNRGLLFDDNAEEKAIEFCAILNAQATAIYNEL